MRRLLVLLFAIQAASAASASAATFTVTNTAGSGAGSLRKAIDDANAAAGADTIAFNVSDGDLPSEGQARDLLRAAALYGARFPGRAVRVRVRALDQPARRRGDHRRLRRGELLPVQSGQPATDGGLPPED